MAEPKKQEPPKPVDAYAIEGEVHAWSLVRFRLVDGKVAAREVLHPKDELAIVLAKMTQAVRAGRP